MKLHLYRAPAGGARIPLWLSLLALLAGSVVRAEDLAQLPVREFVLDNGLTLLLLERHHSPSVACHMAFKVGSNNETVGVTGAAHMLEHMMFKGTKIMSTRDYEAEIPIMEEIDRIANEALDERLKGDRADMEKVQAGLARVKELTEKQRQYIESEALANLYKKNGGTGINAYTANDYTNYIIKLPSNKLELWCWLESDRITNPVFREFYSEKEVVHEERRMRVDTSPSGAMWELFMATAYQAHPYRWMTIGWTSDIENYRRETMLRFLQRYYAPNNAVIIWVGDFKTEEARALIERYFGSIPPQQPPDPLVTREPEQKGERRAVLEFDANPSIVMGWHTVALGSSDQEPLEVAQSILAEGRTSRLYQRLREKEQLASEVYAEQDRSEYPGLFAVAADPIQGVSVERVEQVILEEVERLRSEDVSDWELQRVKNQLQSSFVAQLESNYMLARELADYECKHSWEMFLESERKRQSVTAADIRRVAEKYFTARNRTVVTLKPTGPESKAVSQASGAMVTR
ncbi:MAG: insulinase family protein [Candidatus Omnitrophica bacterium]|nr:insulinase family protein [Candidatus Omnitrophota bacterium]